MELFGRIPLPALFAAGASFLVGCGCGDGDGGQTAAGGGTAPSQEVVPPAQGAARSDWTRFGFDAARSNASRAPAGIRASSLARLERRQVRLPGTVDSSPIYLRDVRVRGRSHDVFVVTTTYGRTLAVDASRARVLWQFTPPGIGGWEGSAQITQASPIADTSRRFVFAASPDGRVHRLSLDSGRETAAGDWPVSLTRDPSHEKLPAALNLSRGRVIVTTGGYLGDAPPYQGKVVTIDRRSGRIVRVFNALCSDRKRIIQPSSCPESGSAIWARAGAVVDPASGRLLAVTGNGDFNERTNWGDSVIELTPDGGRLVGSFTPPNHAELEATDTDFGSTAPAILPDGLVSQSGKDGLVRLLDLRRLPRRGNAAQIQSLPAPAGQGVFSAAAVLRGSGGRAVVYYANDSATAAYELRGRRLRVLWQNGTPGTSPVIAGRLVWIYNHRNGGLNVYRPSSSKPLHTLPSGPGHWNSPIVVDGRVALPEGDGNAHQTSGVLNIYSLRR